MFINQNNRINQNYFMQLALNQARKNLGNTKENPSVGCILVKNNNVISASCTSVNGRPHAEFNAINFANENVKNSDLYVTVEPCSHFGKTKPCVNIIVKNKIKKVFFSINDPDKRSFNKSKKILNNHGILVKSNINIYESNNFYRSYLNFKKNLPFVTCKIAISKDFFKINKNNNKWITNNFSRGRVHLMRSMHDCLITSSKTIINDNPRLTCRINGLTKRSPSRIILDRKLEIPINSKVLKDAYKYKTLVFFNLHNKKKIALLKKFKVKTFKIPTDKSGNLDLTIVLNKALSLGFSRIFLESGLTLMKSFLEKNLIDDLELFISNKNLGNKGKNSIKNNINSLNNKNKYIKKVNLLGDKLITYKLK